MAKDLVLAEQARYDEMHKVVTLHLEGRNFSAIAKMTGIRRADVIGYIDEFKQIAKDDDLLRARAQEVVHEFDAQYSRVIGEFWNVVEEADLNDTLDGLKVKNATLKNLADVQAKRVEVLQKSGLLSDAALGDELAEMEERQEKLIAILRDVTSQCDHCKFEVARRLTQVTGTVEPVTVVSER